MIRRTETYDYGYDNAGNEISKTDIATSDAWTYTYNNANELTSAVETNASNQVENSVAYQYDALGNKIEATTVEYTTAGYQPSATTTVTQYAIDNWNPGNPVGVASVWADLNASSSLQTRYVRTDDPTQILARIDNSGTPVAYWYILDRQNSTRDIITNTAALKDTINYDAYGDILPGYETSPTYGGDYKYTGEQDDSVTGLQYNQARWYDPNTGRWMSQDPEGFGAGDSNLYRYVNNSPMDGVDPSGKQVVGGPGGIGGYYGRQLGRRTPNIANNNLALPPDLNGPQIPPPLTEPVPKLAIGKVVERPLVGQFGTYLWPVKFELDKKSVTGGWIIQLIKFEGKAWNGETDVTPKVFVDAALPLKNSNYFEAWKVPENEKMAIPYLGVSVDKQKLPDNIDLIQTGLEKDDPNFKFNLQAKKDIVAGKWDAVNDFFFNGSAVFQTKKALYTKAEIKITAAVFFIADPFLYEGMRKANDPMATAENKNPAAGLPNLSLTDSAESKGMSDWIFRLNPEYSSNIISRSLTFSWETAEGKTETKYNVGSP